MTAEELTKVAEHVRLMAKELAWCVKHLQGIYNIIRTDEQPEVEDVDPAQLSLFDDSSSTTCID